jgi:outer membrane protein, heavy metal efflux system
MSLFRTVGFCACLTATSIGCRTTPSCQTLPSDSHQLASTSPIATRAETPIPTGLAQPSSIQSLQQQGLAVVPSSQASAPASVAQVAYQQPTKNAVPGTELFPHAPPAMELSLPEFVAEVQARNPSLQAMFAAAQAAAERYPQVVALDDPMFNANLAPASLGSNQVEGAYTLELSQKFPWFGKRAARGRSAKAEAGSAFADAEETRLRLIETSEQAFFDYYLVARQQDLIHWNTEVMRQFRDTAQNKYRANQATQQDTLQADVELAQLERRQLELNRMKVTCSVDRSRSVRI